jgi:hypothetical protein
MRILHAVAEQNRALAHDAGIESRGGMLNDVLQRCDRLAKHDCLVCVISDMNGHDSDTPRLLTRIAAHNDVLIAFVYDPLEAEMPDAGSLTFGDGARQLEIDRLQPPVRVRLRSLG